MVQKKSFLNFETYHELHALKWCVIIVKHEKLLYFLWAWDAVLLCTNCTVNSLVQKFKNGIHGWLRVGLGGDRRMRNIVFSSTENFYENLRAFLGRQKKWGTLIILVEECCLFHGSQCETSLRAAIQAQLNTRMIFEPFISKPFERESTKI